MERYAFDPRRPPSPPLAYPPPDVSRVAPDDWTVWAVTDVHGIHDALLEGLLQAGLVDDRGRWSVPPAQLDVADPTFA